jgi:ribosomal protein S18 acetylase RimI-like enzyme
MTSTIRKPYNDEADICAALIYMSGPQLLQYIYSETEPGIYELLKFFFKRPGTTFSKEEIIVDVQNNKIRGLVLGHPVRALTKLLFKELQCIKNMKKNFIYFLQTLFTLLYRSKLVIHYPRLKNDEFFICNLAVFKEYRRMGVATQLLRKAEVIALEKGLHTLSLYVEIDNTIAKKVYERFGFREVDKAVFPKKYNNYQLYGFYKMTKDCT